MTREERIDALRYLVHGQFENKRALERRIEKIDAAIRDELTEFMELAAPTSASAGKKP